MLSRRHIRIKVMQALYVYFNADGGDRNIDKLSSTMVKNITRMYELYLYMLLFYRELGHFILKYDEQTKTRYLTSNPKESAGALRLYENAILQRLINSQHLDKALSAYKVHWSGEEDILRKIFLDLKNQDIYHDYIQSATENPVLQQEILLFILKHYTTNNPLFQQHLEEQFYNWLDDKKIILQMVAKTIQTIASNPGSEEFLLPLSQNLEENVEYARDLLRLTIEQDEKLQKIISRRITKWEPHQVAMIDNIILKMAVCEFLNFPSIPAKVTINEYIELAKNYSTPQSKKFVNGVLDATLKELKNEGVMIKS